MVKHKTVGTARLGTRLPDGAGRLGEIGEASEEVVLLDTRDLDITQRLGLSRVPEDGRGDDDITEEGADGKKDPAACGHAVGDDVEGVDGEDLVLWAEGRGGTGREGEAGCEGKTGREGDAGRERQYITSTARSSGSCT